jgi:hypothetical protein
MTMRKVVMLGLVLAGAAGGPAVAAQASDAKLRQLVKSRVEAMNTALIRGEYAKLADLTHPKAVEENGGREKMIAAVKDAMQALKAKGIVIRGAKVDLPTGFASAGGEMFTVVPFSLEVTAPGQKITQRTFVIGVSGDGGKTWTFINGDLGVAKVKQLLPNLPKGLKLPENQPPVVEKTE